MNATIEQTEAAAVGEQPVKRSRIFLVAWMAAERALPPESLRLIKAHDDLFDAWRKAGWPSPTPVELAAASKAIEADPLASIAFDLRQKCNQESHKEWCEENTPAPKEAAA